MSIALVLSKSDRFTAEGMLDPALSRVELTLRGNLDETADLARVSTYLSKLGEGLKAVTLDLRGLVVITSAGLRSWITFINALKSASFDVTFSAVSEVFLERTSAFPQMLDGHAWTVVAFEAPYYCLACKKRVVHILKTEEFPVTPEAPEPPARACTDCGKALRFDEVPEDYLGFITRMRSSDRRRS
ncbi:MAG: hypothetical protein NDJ90_12790 [Oligoflexia bacterium]|nr:hypothetical protein [Oligoflexia bacterium]